MKLKSLTIRLPENLHRALKIHCVKRGVRIGFFVATAITAALKGKP